MWYRFSKNTIISDNGKPMGLEEKILRLDAEKAVREHLNLQTDYSPETTTVSNTVNRVIAKFKEDYDDLNTIRNELGGEDLYPMVKKYVDLIMKKKQGKKKSIF